MHGDLEAAFAGLQGEPEVFVIGGGQIYAATVHRCGRLHVTHVDADVDGDVFFPATDWQQWRATEVERQGADTHNTYAFRIVVYEPQ